MTTSSDSSSDTSDEEDPIPVTLIKYLEVGAIFLKRSGRLAIDVSWHLSFKV